MHLKTILISTLLTATTAAMAQDVKGIVQKIRKINEVQYQHVGFAGSESEGYKHYVSLRDKATTAQLVALTNDTNAAVACYAGWALVDKYYTDLPGILYTFLNGKRMVTTFSGCIKSDDYVSSEFYHKYWNSVSEERRAGNKILRAMDSTILYNDNSPWLLVTRALEDRTYPEHINKRIEYLAFEKGKINAINYLSGLHKAAYSPKIKKALLGYMQKTDFSTTGTTDYYNVVRSLLEFKDPAMNKEIIAKLKKDKHWEHERSRFITLLGEYSISEDQLK